VSGSIDPGKEVASLRFPRGKPFVEDCSRNADSRNEQPLALPNQPRPSSNRLSVQSRPIRFQSAFSVVVTLG
jgi:hypothetical protein